ncbi:DUF2500 domain-containing protein [Chimaeribacter californicus]|uniref:DUF2500 domain-containing protein n=1 Tax=Chimaeribacter californicus TaxID=2060067 RepID=A0A2N5E1M0_9GAMM|nr:DUF2500 domain-containing protein [Chimaeribacter californicus]PLR34329.1 DUF2500 domain-containing protein [Chimaeribacter californicus]
MSKPPLIIVLVLLLIAGLATRQYLKQRRTAAENDAAPVQHLVVTVSGKREFPAPNRRSRQREVIPVEEMRYEVSFTPLDRGPMTLVLSAPDYQQIDKGARGTLALQGTRFIAFTPDAAP